MKRITRSLSLHLPKGDLFAIPDVAGLRFACREGCVWITLDDDPRDIVLEAGEVFTGSEHRRALVNALAPACLTIRPVVEEAAVRSPAPLPLLSLCCGPAPAWT
ncbi:DUF2917 domain-containing protein [Ramlibacter terrae]|uniref:DUF2917 domain-containing protein n=1 Tax=Ramlibacter terrae TaxID=2732511 RepID=A0ABX6P6F4_9BURK|nr:DUF2917 domain-containing protein [Ramlibacter terrae]